MLQWTMPFSVIIFLFLVPAPSSSECHFGHEKFTDECKEYCDSKRQSGSYDEFHAGCGAPYDLDFLQTTQSCLFDCATAKCPCQSCPNGQYVICPRIPPPPPPPEPPSSSSSESDGSSGSSVIWIVVGVVAVLVIAGCVGGIWFCSRKRHPNQQQQQQFQYGAPSTTYPNQYQYPSYPGQAMPMYQPPSTTPQSPQVASMTPAPAQQEQGFDYRVDGNKG